MAPPPNMQPTNAGGAGLRPRQRAIRIPISVGRSLAAADWLSASSRPSDVSSADPHPDLHLRRSPDRICPSSGPSSTPEHPLWSRRRARTRYDRGPGPATPGDDQRLIGCESCRMLRERARLEGGLSPTSYTPLVPGVAQRVIHREGARGARRRGGDPQAPVLSYSNNLESACQRFRPGYDRKPSSLGVRQHHPTAGKE
jgi:hypothetical protein